MQIRYNEKSMIRGLTRIQIYKKSADLTSSDLPGIYMGEKA
jgi:hypothetical protein